MFTEKPGKSTLARVVKVGRKRAFEKNAPSLREKRRREVETAKESIQKLASQRKKKTGGGRNYEFLRGEVQAGWPNPQ